MKGPLQAIPLISSEGEDFLHTSEHPFCTDETCPCHEDATRLADVGDALSEKRLDDANVAAVIYGGRALM